MSFRYPIRRCRRMQAYQAYQAYIIQVSAAHSGTCTWAAGRSICRLAKHKTGRAGENTGHCRRRAHLPPCKAYGRQLTPSVP